jgi:hypothetical protein
MLICCGDKICKQHIEELIANNSSTKFMCPLCNEENRTQNFNVDKFMQKMIENQLHKFEISPRHIEILEQLKTEIKNLETIVKNPENLIYDEINELKRQVDLDREQSKCKIDELADELIQKLKSYEVKFKTEYKTNIDLEHYNALVDSSRMQLDEYEKCLKYFSTKYKERKEKSKQSEKLIASLQLNIKEVKENLFSNLVLAYKPMASSFKDLFGKLIIKVYLNL